MKKLEEIRSAVEVLSALSDDEWHKIEETISFQTKSKEDEKQISFDEKEKKVTELLKLLGMPSHIKGYDYTRKAVLLIIEDREKYLWEITKKLYPTIARYFKTTSSRVERDIRHAAEIAWERGDQEMQNKVFGYSSAVKLNKPKNSQLIADIANFIQLNML